ncbi:MAG: ClpX C4-type zinc finger protein [Candidatus Obscuribacterales bacterium]
MADNSEKQCSFCNKSQDSVALLIEKPGLFICNECVAEFNRTVSNADISEEVEVDNDCSFCSFMRSHPFLQALVRPGRRLIRGPRHSICNECLDVCNEILRDYKISE